MKITGISIFLLEKLYNTDKLERKVAYMRTLPPHTTGFTLANLLDTNGYRLIPSFEDHDLKHLLLGYAYTMPDEIRMQAYLIGNGNFTWPCLVFFLSLLWFYPSSWRHLLKDYRQGRRSPSILALSIDDCMELPLQETICRYGRSHIISKKKVVVTGG